MEDKKDIGLSIKAFRKKKRLTQDELGDIMGVSPGVISQIERGKQYPTFVSLQKLSEKYLMVGF